MRITYKNATGLRHAAVYPTYSLHRQFAVDTDRTVRHRNGVTSVRSHTRRFNALSDARKFAFAFVTR